MDEFVKDKEQDAFEKFSSEALHLTRKGSFEQLLAQHLIQSVSMGPPDRSGLSLPTHSLLVMM